MYHVYLHRNGICMGRYASLEEAYRAACAISKAGKKCAYIVVDGGKCHRVNAARLNSARTGRES